jgi:hypothetical protein
MFGIPEAVDAVFTFAKTAIDKIWPDANEELKAKLAEYTTEIQAELSIQLANVEVNKAEAVHPSIFIAGWRPAIGWVGAAALAYQTVISPIANGVASYFGTMPFPTIDTGLLETLILGMLGLGVARTYEKAKGVETKRI